MIRRLGIPLLLTLALSAQAPKSYAVNTGWGPKPDKIKHFVVGAAIAVPVYLLSDYIGNNDPLWDVLFWATLAALVKENYDRHHGGRPDYADVGYTELGAFTAAFAVRWGTKPKPEFATAPKLDPTAKDLRDLHSTTKEVQ